MTDNLNSEEDFADTDNESNQENSPPKVEKNAKLSKTKHQSKLIGRSACDVIKGKRGPLLGARIGKTNRGIFTLH